VVVEVTSEAEEKVFPRVFVTDQNPVVLWNVFPYKRISVLDG